MSTPEAREAELAALRRRAAELTQAMAAHRQVERQLAETEQRLGRFLETTSEMVAFSVDGIIVEVNRRFHEALGYDERELIGVRAIEIAAPEFRDATARVIATNSTEPYECECLRKDGSRIALEICGRATLHQGRPARVTRFRDITERKRAEAAARTAVVQREVIRAQEAMLAELSIPLLPIREDILVLPLIGAVTAERAAQVVRALVEGVARHRARTAILDITGVPDVDDQVADALLRAARAVRLLGARVILTGIRPDVAQRFVLLGTDLTGIMTYGTLERGVARALAGRTRAAP